jgi:hypothetical protein
MKSLYWLVITILSLWACKKEDSIYNVGGIVTDGSSGQPIVGLPLTVYKAGGGINAAWHGELKVVVLDEELTEEDGRFSIMFDKTNLSSEFESVYLGCDSIPNGYQNYVRVDQDLGNLYLDKHDYYANWKPISVFDHQDLSLKMFQQAYFNLALPPLTQDLKQDTLVLKLSTSYEYNEQFHLGNSQEVQSLLKIRELMAADRAIGTYLLRRGTIIKSGSFDVFCSPHDTTEVYLNL